MPIFSLVRLPYMSTLAERIHETLQESGSIAADLARACGVKPPSVSAWLSGETKSLKASTAIRAAEFLGVSQLWLTEGKGPKYPSRATPDELPSLSAAQRDAIQAALSADGWKVSRCGSGIEKLFDIGVTPMQADLRLEKDGHVLWGVFFPWHRVERRDLLRVLSEPGLVGLGDDPETSLASAQFALQSARRAADPDNAAAEDAAFDSALERYNIAPIGELGSALIVARPPIVSEEIWESLSSAVHALIQTTVDSARCGGLSDAQAEALTQLILSIKAGTPPA